MTFLDIKNELVSGLLDIFQDNVSSIILYGSVAKNKETEESDIDIAVIVNKRISDEDKEAFINWCAYMDLKYDCVLSVIDIEKEKFTVWGNTLPFYKNVSEEGVILWTAA